MGDGRGPKDRENILSAISPEQAPEHHALLRELLTEEAEYRRSGDHEFFENLYWVAYLLYCVGDVTDVEAMWDAKNIDFDTRIGFDFEFVLGAGVDTTVQFLRESWRADILEYLEQSVTTDTDLVVWNEFRRNYFYPQA